MDSDSSSDLNLNDINAIKKESSETDYYLNLIANNTKIAAEEASDSSELELEDSEKEDTFKNINMTPRDSFVPPRQSPSRAQFENINIDSDSPQSRHSSRHSSKRSRRSSHHSTESDYIQNHKVNETTSEVYGNKTPTATSHIPPYVKQQNERMKKIELLRKLCELKAKGYKLSKEYNYNSSIEEMEYEYDLLKSFADKRNGVKLYKNIILNACSVIEFMNEKYDPFSFKLSGWSKHMDMEVDSYEDVLEELYEKYRGRGKSMPPELKLFLLILASASAFHFSKSFDNTMPGVSQVLQSNPQFIPNLINGGPKQQQFMSEQEMNIHRQRQEMQQRERQRKEAMRNHPQQNAPQPSPPQQTQPVYQQSYAQPFPGRDNFTSGQTTNIPSTGPPTGMINSNDPRDNKPPVIKRNQNVQDILKNLHADNTEEESSVNNDRILSDTTATASETTSARRRKKKAMMVIT
jgi:hypothetical protein